jgi:hypothetical protein
MHFLPWYVYQFIKLYPGKVGCRRYSIDRKSKICSMISSPEVFEPLQKSQVVKACILSSSHDSASSTLVYTGNYVSSKLLLSRFTWPSSTGHIHFLDFMIRDIYRAILHLDSYEIPSIQRWETILSYPISTRWEAFLRYLHDPIFLNKTKEKLYKIYTRALPVSKKLHGPNVSQLCCFCGILDDELHCFVYCIRLRPL